MSIQRNLPNCAKLLEFARNPYALLRAQYVSLHNERVLQEGALDDLIFPPMTKADQFDSKITSAVWVAHWSIALSNPKKLTARKEIASCARALANTLQALRPEDKEILLHFLPHHRQATFGDFVTATSELADEAQSICSLVGRPSSWAKRQAQRSFMRLLWKAVDDAGGKLTLNTRTERGTLIDAIELLRPYLPQKISKRPSFSI